MKRSNLCMAGVVALTLAMAPMAGAQTSTTADVNTNANDMTISGTVVSTTGDQLVITTDAGQSMTFSAMNSVNVPTNMAVGNRVTVTYRPLTGGDYQVSRVVIADASTSTTGSTYTDQSATSTSTGTTTYADNTYDNDLPATASPLPIAGLLGLLSLGAGLGLQALRNRR